jgi:hypothetical protein
MSILIMIFEHEYNDIWTERFAALGEWLVKNDEQLEATTNSPRKLTRCSHACTRRGCPACPCCFQLAKRPGNSQAVEPGA